jgi:hypothetical protein
LGRKRIGAARTARNDDGKTMLRMQAIQRRTESVVVIVITATADQYSLHGPLDEDCGGIHKSSAF